MKRRGNEHGSEKREQWAQKQHGEELSELFVGKSGIFDHEWTAKGQAARIYRTEIVEEEGVCSQGEGRCYLKGYAYMLRGGENDALIAQIEGGIKKEVLHLW